MAVFCKHTGILATKAQQQERIVIYADYSSMEKTLFTDDFMLLHNVEPKSRKHNLLASFLAFVLSGGSIDRSQMMENNNSSSHIIFGNNYLIGSSTQHQHPVYVIFLLKIHVSFFTTASHKETNPIIEITIKRMPT